MECELRAFTRFALHLDIAPMCLHNTARDGKSQPSAAAATVARPRSVTAIKALEDVWDILDADAFAGVADGHIDARTPAPYPDADPSLAGRMPQGVADQVVEHAPDRLCVHQDGVDILLHLAFQRDLLLFCKLGKALERIRDEVAARRRRALERKATRIEL